MPQATPTPPSRDGFHIGVDVADTVESLFAEQGPRRPVFEWVVLLLLGSALASLPVVKIDLTLAARGLVDPTPETAVGLQDLAEDRAPPRELTLSAFLAEREIKFLRVGQPAVIQFDAYPYTEWGNGSGTVVDIAERPTTVGQRSLFKVAVRSDTTTLRLPDGRSGPVVGGMAATVRFIVNRKSLLQLIYQKSEALLGPG